MGRVLQRAEVWLHSDGLTDEMARDALLHPVADLTAAVAAAVAPAGRRGTGRGPARRPADGGHGDRRHP